MTKEKIEFFEKYAGMAIEQQQKYGIPASVTLAQAWWERGQAAENENNMESVVNFINATKKADEEYSDKEVAVPVEDIRKNTRRNIQTFVLVVLAMIMTAIIIFIIWRVFSLIE